VGSGGVSSELMRQQAHANGPMNHFADVVDAATAASANAPAPTPPSPFAGLRAAAASKTSSAAHVLSRGWESAAAAGGGGLGGYSGMSAREPKSDGETVCLFLVLVFARMYKFSCLMLSLPSFSDLKPRLFAQQIPFTCTRLTFVIVVFLIRLHAAATQGSQVGFLPPPCGPREVERVASGQVETTRRGKCAIALLSSSVVFSSRIVSCHACVYFRSWISES
jgi:hypothetical protein